MAAVVTVFGLIPRYIGGSENYARELSLQLATHGWKSVVCFLSEPPQGIKRYLDLPNISIEVLENAADPRPNLSTLKKLSKILRKHDARILHLHLVGFVGPYPWLARLHGVEKVFFTNHMSQPEGFVAKRWPFWKRVAVRIINWPMSKVICVSEYNQRCLQAFDLLPRKKITCIYNGVDFERANPNPERARAFRQRHGIPAERQVVIQISWMIPEKGVSDLLQAAKLVIQKEPAVHFVFVGEGAGRDSFQQQASDLGIRDHVTWTGLLQDPFAEGVYDAADIACQPSRWDEAFGQVIAEAMAYGKPVIGSAVGGIPEVIEAEVSGFLIPKRDVSALAEKLLCLLRSRDVRERMGSASQLASRSKFDLKKTVSQLINLYVQPSR
jgi:glycosyltransferase involved in cell wall biosynthesis